MESCLESCFLPNALKSGVDVVAQLRLTGQGSLCPSRAMNATMPSSRERLLMVSGPSLICALGVSVQSTVTHPVVRAWKSGS